MPVRERNAEMHVIGRLREGTKATECEADPVSYLVSANAVCRIRGRWLRSYQGHFGSRDNIWCRRTLSSQRHCRRILGIRANCSHSWLSLNRLSEKWRAATPHARKWRLYRLLQDVQGDLMRCFDA